MQPDGEQRAVNTTPSPPPPPRAGFREEEQVTERVGNC